MTAQFTNGKQVRFSSDRRLGEALTPTSVYEIVDRDGTDEIDCCVAVIDGNGIKNWFDVSRFELVEPEGLADWERELLAEHAEPEDATDAYVEPEPLKGWEQEFLDAQVVIDTQDREEIHRFIACLPADWGLIDTDGSTLSETIEQVQAALREFANPKPARCTSLFDSGEGSLVRCAEDEHDATTRHRFLLGYWTDAEAYGRVEVSS